MNRCTAKRRRWSIDEHYNVMLLYARICWKGQEIYFQDIHSVFYSIHYFEKWHR